MQAVLSQLQSELNPATLLPKVWDFVKSRLEKIDFFDETKADLQKESPWYQLGGMYYWAWMCVIATGVLLIAFYLPTIDLAYNSVDVLSESFWGSVLRGMHKYGGDAMIIAATLRIYRMWFTAEYKNKGEFTFILAIILLLVAMYSGLSGYLLIWNQRAFWATKVFATFPTYLDITPKIWYWPWEGHVLVNGKTWLIPNIVGAITKVIGDVTHQGVTTSQALMGGSSIGQATLTRFFALHFALSVLLLIVTELYFYKNRLKRVNLSTGVKWLMLGMICFVAIIFPAESGSRANPEVTPLPILSDWYFLALYQMLKYMDPYWATIWTVGIPVVTIALMFLDWGPERNPWKRPIFTSVCIMAIIQFIIFSLLIIANQANLDRDPPYWYASMFLFLTLGMFWHWSLYRQKLPLVLWTGFCLVSSLFYLWFWHVSAEPWLAIWWNTAVTQNTAFVIPKALLEVRPETGFNFTNLYWNFLWAGYAVVQAAVAAPLVLFGKNEVPMGEALPTV
ncbi:MAG: cytochrome b N-terminal domain-containing protein [Vampirovibrionales bacterium]